MSASTNIKPTHIVCMWIFLSYTLRKSLWMNVLCVFVCVCDSWCYYICSQPSFSHQLWHSLLTHTHAHTLIQTHTALAFLHIHAKAEKKRSPRGSPRVNGYVCVCVCVRRESRLFEPKCCTQRSLLHVSIPASSFQLHPSIIFFLPPPPLHTLHLNSVLFLLTRWWNVKLGLTSDNQCLSFLRKTVLCSSLCSYQGDLVS